MGSRDARQGNDALVAHNHRQLARDPTPETTACYRWMASGRCTHIETTTGTAAHGRDMAQQAHPGGPPSYPTHRSRVTEPRHLLGTPPTRHRRGLT